MTGNRNRSWLIEAMWTITMAATLADSGAATRPSLLAPIRNKGSSNPCASITR